MKITTGQVGETFRLDVGDEVAAIPSSVHELQPDGASGPYPKLKALNVTIENGSVRVAMGGVDPNRAPAALGHKRDSGDALRITGNTNCKSLKFTADEAGVAAVVQISPEYE